MGVAAPQASWVCEALPAGSPMLRPCQDSISCPCSDCLQTTFSEKMLAVLDIALSTVLPQIHLTIAQRLRVALLRYVSDHARSRQYGLCDPPRIERRLGDVRVVAQASLKVTPPPAAARSSSTEPARPYFRAHAQRPRQDAPGHSNE